METGSNFLLWILSLASLFHYTVLQFGPEYPLHWTEPDGITLHCPDGWTKYTAYCYKVFTEKVGWGLANHTCTQYGGHLVVIKDEHTNFFIGNFIRNSFTELDSVWIGLHRLGVRNDLEAWWTLQDNPVNLALGTWAISQPNILHGNCTSMLTKENTYFRWTLEACVTPKPFVCQSVVCLKGEGRCTDGKCIPSSWFCDGVPDCSDASDELWDLETGQTCASKCQMKQTGTTGLIEHTGSTSGETCTWHIETPLGTSVNIKFEQLNLRDEVDTIRVFVGGRTVSSSHLVTTMTSSALVSSRYVSPNHWMILVLSALPSSSSSNTAQFRASWKVTDSCELTEMKGYRVVGTPFSEKNANPDCRSACQNMAHCKVSTFRSKDSRCLFYDVISQPIRDDCCTTYIQSCSGAPGTPNKWGISEGGNVPVHLNSRMLFSPFYPAIYSATYMLSWTLRSPNQWTIITIQVIDTDLGREDEMAIYNGESNKQHPMASYRANSTFQAITLSTTGPFAYIEMAKSPSEPGRGFLVFYETGCTVVLNAMSGIIQSPGYTGTSTKSAPLQICSWTMSSANHITVHFPIEDAFSIHDSDILEINGERVKGDARPSNILSSGNSLHLRFTTSVSDEAVGFRALYSSDCPSPILPDNSVARSKDGTILQTIPVHFKSVFVYTCDIGYEYVSSSMKGCDLGKDIGTIEVECQFHGLWSRKDLPKCRKKYCGSLGIPNGYIKEVTSYEYGGRISVGCYQGFTLLGGEAHCSQSGTWNNVPTCQKITCPKLNDIKFGDIKYSNSKFPYTSPGTIADYVCKAGFSTKEESRIHCLLNGTWSSTRGIACRRRSCKVPYVPNGRTEDIYYATGITRIKLTCAGGYEIEETRSILYETDCPPENNTVVLPQCVDIDECSRGRSSCMHECINTSPNYTCSCHDGYELDDDGFSCKDVNECVKYPDLCKNGRCENSEGKYRCVCDSGQGWVLLDGTEVNDYSIKNGETGLDDWNVYRINHTCIPVRCPSLGSSTHSQLLSSRQWFYFGDIVQILCDIGHVLEGTQTPLNTLECLYTGQWNTTTSCIPEKCQPLKDIVPADIVNGPKTISPFVSVPYQGSVNITCNVEGKGEFTRELHCLRNPFTGQMEWVGDSIECGVIDCGQPPVIASSMSPVVPDGSTTYGSIYTLHCMQDYISVGSSSKGDNKIRCQSNGHWDVGDLRCVSAACTDPGTPSDSIQISSSYEVGSSVNFTCKSGYILSHEEPLTCVDNAHRTYLWNRLPPRCIDKTAPTFSNCETNTLYYTKYQMLNVDMTVSDNSGPVKILSVNTQPGTVLLVDTNITWIAIDNSGNTATCTISILVSGVSIGGSGAACNPGFISSTGQAPCMACPRGYYQPSSGQTSCHACAEDQITQQVASIAATDCTTSCYTHTCENGGTCTIANRIEVCKCRAGTTGLFCETVLSGCVSRPCYNGGTCQPLDNTNTCLCPTGISGTECESNVNDCSSNCANSAPCQDLNNDYKCLCKTTDIYTGKRCDTVKGLNVCEKEPCLNGGQCTPLNSFRRNCFCTQGFTGLSCETEIDECESNPCVFGGTCINERGGYRCNCPDPLTGSRCEVDGSVRDACTCGDHGTCVHDYINVKDICICQKGFADVGSKLWCTDIDECLDNPCRNEGTCRNEIGSYRCDCAQGYEGHFCQHYTEGCSTNPCLHGGRCEDRSPEPYECFCASGFTGINCETNINDCAFGDNVISCQDLINDCQCTCSPGWTGKDCESNIDDCEPNPCHHGSCSDLVNDYMCSCEKGWEGRNCHLIQQSCQPGICGSGQCHNVFRDFICSCGSFTVGNRCEITVDECSVSNRCLNHGSCSSLNGQTSCSCPLGWTGDVCQCHEYCTRSCHNGGTCQRTDLGDEYCQCPLDYTGQFCQNTIDDCGGVSCGEGTCLDGIGTYFCHCPPGRAGSHCQAQITRSYDVLFIGREQSSLLSPFILDAEEFTLVFWFKYARKQIQRNVLCLMGTTLAYSAQSQTPILCVSHEGVQLHIMSQSLVLGSGSFTAHTWHYVAVTWSKPTGQVVLYVNSAQRDVYQNSQLLNSYNYPTYATITLAPGEPSATEPLFSGTISNVILWQRLLTGDEIYNAGYSTLSSSDQAGIIVDWANFDLSAITVITPPECKHNCQASGMTKVVPFLGDCPNDIIKPLKDLEVGWKKPAFSGFFRATNTADKVERVGLTRVVYVALGESQDNATAICTFDVYFNVVPCPDPQSIDTEIGRRSILSYGSLYTGYEFRCPNPSLVTCAVSAQWTLYSNVCEDGVVEMNIQFGWIYDLSTEPTEEHLQTISSNLKTRFDKLNENNFNRICDQLGCSDQNRRVQLIQDAGDPSIVTVNIDVYNVIAVIGNIPIESFITHETLVKGYFVDQSMVDGDVIPVETYFINSVPLCPSGHQASGPYCVECTAGTYYEASTGTCNLCDAGLFSIRGQTTCVPCPSGKTTVGPGASPSSQCYTDCSTGNYYDDSCLACPRGTYQNATGQTDCKKCPPGQRTQSQSATSEADCQDCGDGHIDQVNGVCSECAKGTYRQKGVHASCQPCPFGTTTKSNKAVTKTDCSEVKCPGGFYLPQSGDKCIPCRQGTYREDVSSDQSGCTACPLMHRTDRPGSPSANHCKPYCEGGSYLSADKTFCIGCPAGSYKEPSHYYSTECTKCPDHRKITTQPNATSLSFCKPGTCGKGQYKNPSGNTPECLDCDYGYYQPMDYPVERCTSCDSGESTRSKGSIDITSCLKYCMSGEELNEGVCKKCERGYYKSNDNNQRFSQCLKCPIGFITEGEGATSASQCNIADCGAGSYYNKGICEPCPLDHYQEEKWSETCKRCPDSTGTEDTSATSPSDCLSYCADGLEMSGSNCVDCQIGYYKDNKEDRFGTCKKCPTGVITSGTGSKSRDFCNIGDCGPGYFIDSNLNNECSPCPIGEYQDKKWQRQCKTCPRNTQTVNLNSTSVEQCTYQLDVLIAVMKLVFDEKFEGHIYDNMNHQFTISLKNVVESKVRQQLLEDGIQTMSVSLSTIGPGSIVVLLDITVNKTLLPTSSMSDLEASLTVTNLRIKFQDSSLKLTSVQVKERAQKGGPDPANAECSGGKYFDFLTNQCTPCPEGFYQPLGVRDICRPCQDGFSTSLSSGNICLRVCPAGQESATNDEKCHKCSVGYYKEMDGVEPCTKCSQGEWVHTSETGSKSATLCIVECEKGHYNDGNQTDCIKCPKNTYNDKRGQRVCTPCPAATITRQNASEDRSLCIPVCEETGNEYCYGHGECVVEKEQVSCICDEPYNGHRCQWRDADPPSLAKRIISIVFGVIGLVLVVFFICLAYRHFRGESKRNNHRPSIPNHYSTAPLGIPASAVYSPVLGTSQVPGTTTLRPAGADLMSQEHATERTTALYRDMSNRQLEEDHALYDLGPEDPHYDEQRTATPARAPEPSTRGPLFDVNDQEGAYLSPTEGHMRMLADYAESDYGYARPHGSGADGYATPLQAGQVRDRSRSPPPPYSLYPSRSPRSEAGDTEHEYATVESIFGDTDDVIIGSHPTINPTFAPRFRSTYYNVDPYGRPNYYQSLNRRGLHYQTIAEATQPYDVLHRRTTS